MSAVSNLLRAAALALAVVVAACGTDGPGAGQVTPGINSARHQDAPYLVLVSLDGFRHDYLDRYPSPALGRIAAEGVRAESLIPVFPTKTFTSHYTIATGLYAENHGLVGNRFWDPERGATYSLGDREAVEDGTWYRGEPIWVTAERQGMVSAAFYFVGTEADVGGRHPTYWKRYQHDFPNAQRVDTVLAWLDLPPDVRPHVVTLYFADLDDAGHTYGPDAPEVPATIAAVDEQLGRLLDGIAALPHGDQVYVMVVSDHGMLKWEASRAQPVDVGRFPGVRMVEWGPYASFWVDEGGPERLPGLRDSLQAILPEADVWIRGQLPERLHYNADPRIGHVVALAHAGSTIVSSDRVPTRDGHTHGWDNLTPEMGGIFLARGPGIAAGQRIPPFEAVHIYPLMAHLLGLEPAAVDGRLEVLAPILGEAR